jgi:hypothetical protein
MPYLTGSGETVHFKIKREQPQSRFARIDRVDERDLAGTSRTMVTRVGFGSPELAMTIWLDTQSDFQKLDLLRGSVVEYDGVLYDFQFSSPPRSYEQGIYEVQIRMKRVTI